MSSHVTRIGGNTDATTTRADTDAAPTTPRTVAQDKPNIDVRLGGLPSSPGISASPRIRALSNALQHPIASLARHREELKKELKDLHVRAELIRSSLWDERFPKFEGVVNDISHYRPKRERRGPLAVIAQQIGDLPKYHRLSAFDRVYDLIVRQPEDQQDLLLSILATQIPRLPEDGRLSKFERIADRAPGRGMVLDRLYQQLQYLDELDQQAARATLMRVATT